MQGSVDHCVIGVQILYYLVVETVSLMSVCYTG